MVFVPKNPSPSSPHRLLLPYQGFHSTSPNKNISASDLSLSYDEISRSCDVVKSFSLDGELFTKTPRSHLSEVLISAAYNATLQLNGSFTGLFISRAVQH